MTNTANTLPQLSVGTPILVLMMLAMMVLPLPPLMLDILFTFNISLSLVVLLACVYTQRPLNFSVFPTILLLATLLRLALNVASTRVVLLNGHSGTQAAGHVVQSFGSVVIGSNTAVGLVVFTILVIINFVVVTKGASRVSEVTARFTLDAMPGKQMAIDADLNSGLITQDVAKIRREEVAQEADFYGAMDGAVKFVRGDAIAGILILLVNMIGGLVIGVSQHQMALAHAAHNYTLLTIGDGLVAQIPSLLLSSATAIIVTRATRAQDMGTQVLSQLFHHPQTLMITAVVVGALGITPGMPHFAFLTLAALAAGAAFYTAPKLATQSANTTNPQGSKSRPESGLTQPHQELGWDDVIPLDMIGLELGYRLIKMASSADNKLIPRIKGVRKKLSQEVGFLIPATHIRDNLELGPNHYRITLLGVNYGESDVQLDKLLAINPGEVRAPIPGTPTLDPTFGLAAIWIDPEQKNQAMDLGYTVVDPATVIATHLSHILQNHVAQLFGHEEAQRLLDRLTQSAPKLSESLVPKAISLSTFVKVLKQLLNERIPILDSRNIATALIDAAHHTQEPEALTTAVRIGLKRLIVQRINGVAKEIPVIALSSELTQTMLDAQNRSGHSGLGLEPERAQQLIQQITQYHQQQSAAGKPTIVLCTDTLRPRLAKFLHSAIQQIHVLAFSEIPEDKHVRILENAI